MGFGLEGAYVKQIAAFSPFATRLFQKPEYSEIRFRDESRYFSGPKPPQDLFEERRSSDAH